MFLIKPANTCDSAPHHAVQGGPSSEAVEITRGTPLWLLRVHETDSWTVIARHLFGSAKSALGAALAASERPKSSATLFMIFPPEGRTARYPSIEPVTAVYDCMRAVETEAVVRVITACGRHHMNDAGEGAERSPWLLQKWPPARHGRTPPDLTTDEFEDFFDEDEFSRVSEASLLAMRPFIEILNRHERSLNNAASAWLADYGRARVELYDVITPKLR